MFEGRSGEELAGGATGIRPEEVAGGAATLVDPLDLASIASGIEKVLEDTAYAAEKCRQGLVSSKRFDWDIAARKTLDFYRQVLRG